MWYGFTSSSLALVCDLFEFNLYISTCAHTRFKSIKSFLLPEYREWTIIGDCQRSVGIFISSSYMWILSWKISDLLARISEPNSLYIHESVQRYSMRLHVYITALCHYYMETRAPLYTVHALVALGWAHWESLIHRTQPKQLYWHWCKVFTHTYTGIFSLKRAQGLAKGYSAALYDFTRFQLRQGMAASTLDPECPTGILEKVFC